MSRDLSLILIWEAVAFDIQPILANVSKILESLKA